MLQMTIWRKRFACYITKATNTHSQYVTLIASPLQQRLHKRASILRYTNYCSLSCSEMFLNIKAQKKKTFHISVLD